jgi:hypothetical protein
MISALFAHGAGALAVETSWLDAAHPALAAARIDT